MRKRKGIIVHASLITTIGLPVWVADKELDCKVRIAMHGLMWTFQAVEK